FVGDSVVLDADVRGGRAHCALGVLPLERPGPEGAIRILLRPEQLQLGEPTGAAPTARVHSVDFYGHDARVLLDLPSGLRVTARLDGHELPADGAEVSISVTGAALAFPAGPAAEVGRRELTGPR
ncbi:MAG TPA: TOBE domain-containing protein, partial [Modestobacter sp.]|nr:TOBE domain-containing protein [Modestobacter sp.]